MQTCLNDKPIYLPGAAIRQQLKPSHSELLYYSPWQVNPQDQNEDVWLELNQRVSWFKAAISKAVDAWHAKWLRKGMKRAYPKLSKEELDKDEGKRCCQPSQRDKILY